ncbi:uncharacterized protein MELLADRAFT_105545 [Melampsora larici-populina 98AG31]|uniref:Uncharacterized protein n=1 Tax=Melampsora larici-populina (strain 98AG31 / pathotype 3-4-7) TaxID=747676 RepID=F4RIK6_MELLP|nr:uncharacterized protein MELLADRAFT_105545 [Melampsora larici-populina 98AG31]EGG07820.1 hypothetical protein MELLADRAFT_105545 [Melampsora larici-populina 98AG31]
MSHPNNNSSAPVGVTTNTSSSAASSHAPTRMRNPMVEQVVSSSLPITVPQSLLISANPMASLQIFAEAERAKTRGQTSSQRVSWTSAWSRFPTSSLAQSAQVHATANHTNDRKRPRPPTAEFETDALVSVGSSTSQAARLPLRKRRKNMPNRNPFYPSYLQSPTPSILSLSSTVSTGDTTDSDVHDLTEDEDRDENNEYLVPAYPCLPPTPLTPHDVLQSTTLSRMFSRANRTFHQIANSATGLVEADQSTCNRMGELVEVLRGDLGGRRWFEVVERAFLSPTSKEVLSNSTRNGKSTASSIAQKPPQNDSVANAGKETSSNALPGRRRIQSMEQPGLDARSHRVFGGSSDATNHLESGSDSLNESHRLMLDPRYQILTQAPGFIQSLFVSSDPVTVPMMYRPPNDVRGLHASQQTQPSELNTSQKINGASTGSNTKSHPASVASGNGSLENLSIQQQIDSYHDCTIEISKFLGDLTDYRDRLLEVRDGCLSVDKRRRALWAIVKVCANGYDEICNGQNSNTKTESSAVAASTMESKQEPNGTVHTGQSTAPSRTNGHTETPSLRGKSRAR